MSKTHFTLQELRQIIREELDGSQVRKLEEIKSLLDSALNVLKVQGPLDQKTMSSTTIHRRNRDRELLIEWLTQCSESLKQIQ